MTRLARRVARALTVHGPPDDGGLIPPGARVAVAVSGGSDSVALAWLLQEIAADAPWNLAALLHVHHGTRGPASDEDEAFCRDLAGRIDVAFVATRVDAPAHASTIGRSLEVAARALRYRALDEAADRLRADRVATGHTLDDQAETVLMRLLRGAGARGLSAIRRRRGRYVRPLLDVRRAELRTYLETRGEPFRHDPSNDDVRIPRNRIRHELLPLIERLTPGGVRAIARSAALFALDEAYFEAVVIRELDSLVLPDSGPFPGGGVAVDRAALARLPAAVAHRLIRDLVERLAGRPCTVRHIEAVARLARADNPNGHLDLPGLGVERRQDTLVISPVVGPRPALSRAAAAFDQVLDVPGRVQIAAAGVEVVARWGTADDDARASDADRAVVQRSAVTLPLRVRSRLAGDRFRPLGAPGRRKLQDVLVDRKVRREARDRVPLVVDATGRIVWVGGVAVAHDCRVTHPREGVVVLELRR